MWEAYWELVLRRAVIQWRNQGWAEQEVELWCGWYRGLCQFLFCSGPGTALQRNLIGFTSHLLVEHVSYQNILDDHNLLLINTCWYDVITLFCRMSREGVNKFQSMNQIWPTTSFCKWNFIGKQPCLFVWDCLWLFLYFHVCNVLYGLQCLKY